MWEIVKNNKYSVGLVALVLVLAGGYSFYSFDSGTDPEADSVSTTQPVGEEFFALVDQLERVNFQTSLFNDPVYQSLRGFGYRPIPREEGRFNPFASIGDSPGREVIQE